MVPQLGISQAKIWTQAFLTQKPRLSHYALLLPRSCWGGSAQRTTHSFVYSFIHPTSNYPSFVPGTVLAMERPYILLEFLQTAPAGFEEKPSRIRVLCWTVKVVRAWSYQQVRVSLAPLGVFPLKGTNPKLKMRLNASCPPGSTAVAAMPPWHPFETVSSWSRYFKKQYSMMLKSVNCLRSISTPETLFCSLNYKRLHVLRKMLSLDFSKIHTHTHTKMKLYLISFIS